MAISIGSAIGSGFTLIGRRFVSVIAWGFFLYIAILVLFGIGFFAAGGPAAFSQLSSLSGTTDPQAIGQAMLRLFAALWPSFLLITVGALILGPMVQGAVYRSILLPEQKAFFSLRFGGRELSLLLLSFVFFLFAILVYIVSAIVLGGMIYLATRVQGAVGVLIAVVVCIAYAVGLIWVFLRFALAAPMTFAEGRVRFFGSWGLTRGHGWAMFGLAIVVGLAAIGVSLAFSLVSSIFTAIFAGAAVAQMQSSGGAPDTAALMSHLPMLALAYLPSLIISAVSQGFTQAIVQAPWMDVYRQLKGSPDVATTFS